MTLFISYLFSAPMALLPPLFVLTFMLILWLYGLPMYALGYAAALCVPAYAVLLGVGFTRFRRRHRLLSGLLENAALCAEHLPDTLHTLESDYQALLRSLSAERARLADEMENRYSERIGYYTLWAHQIKTPISAIRLLLSEKDDENAREIACELSRVEQYVNMALCYLRLDANSTDYTFASYALEPMVRSVARSHAASFIRGHLRLILDPLPLNVLTDEKWLSFVIDQLITNAIKYTPAGGSVHIGLCHDTTLFFEDTGIGIAPEDLPRIFEQGFTGLNGRTDKRASGIGLYLCRRICRNLGHSIRCTSTPGKGTRLEIDLGRKPLMVE